MATPIDNLDVIGSYVIDENASIRCQYTSTRIK